MKMHVRVKRDGVFEPVTIGPKAIVRWEEDTGQKISSLVKGIGLSDMADLSYRQLVIDGRAPATYDEFLDQLEELEAEDSPDP